MAIQIPNPGTGNGQTGDNEFVLWSKVKNNFENQTHAASRLVGKEFGQLAENDLNGVGGTGLLSVRVPDITHNGINTLTQIFDSTVEKLPAAWGATEGMGGIIINRGTRPVGFVFGNRAELKLTYCSTTGWTQLVKVYTSANTTLDSNGALKPSSPVLRVYSDKLDGNEDGEAMGATYTKNSVGNYTITGTTGLRSDGWYIVIPNDMNGNPKVAVTLDDTDGVITLKTYARIFDMTTFKFVPDLDQPLDIPDGRWIDLRFNDLPIDDMQMGV